MDFLAAVNRVLRQEGIIRGDDDNASSFSTAQHPATISLAKIAVQDELTHLVASNVIIPELKVDTISTSSGTRTYSVASDFVRITGKTQLHEQDDSGNATQQTIPFADERDLSNNHPDYREIPGTPTAFYLSGTTAPLIGLYPVPNINDKVYRYYYEADVSVTVETDTLPFYTESSSQIFAEIAARRFKYQFATPQVREGLFPKGLDRDPAIQSARATLFSLLKGHESPRSYGRRHG